MMIPKMTITIDLRTEAEAEAARVRAVKARPPAAVSARPLNGIPVTVIRRPTTPGLRRSTAIFFTRTRCVDGSGRLVEERLIPVEVSGDIGGHPQEVFVRGRALVRSVCLAEIAKRLGDLAAEYRHGLERARARESQLAALARADREALVQPGLFDRRTLKHDAAAADHGRPESLASASSLLVAQHTETVLLLVMTS